MANQKKLAREWFKAGKSDYEYAKVGLKQKDIYPQVGFLCQQTAEKYLKGYLILNKIKPPRTHDLTLLLSNVVKINSQLRELANACELLMGFYIESRYPPDIPNYTEDELRQAFLAAEKVKDKVEKLGFLLTAEDH